MSDAPLPYQPNNNSRLKCTPPPQTIMASFKPSTRCSFSKLNHPPSSSSALSPQSTILFRLNTAATSNNNSFAFSSSLLKLEAKPLETVIVRSSTGGGGGNEKGGSGNGGGFGSGGGGGEEEGDKNKAEIMLALAGIGKSLESVPADLIAAVETGRVPVSILHKYLELEKSAFFHWLLQFGGFRERLLADDLFLAKVSFECCVGVFTKTLAEYERRRENFMKELDFVIADVVMAIVADFMLVWLPAPTVSLRPPLAVSAGAIAQFFHHCPDNAFQVALAGTSYSLLQRIGSITRNGAKLFAVGTSASLIGTSVTNALIKARKKVDKSMEGEVEELPIISTSVAYGVYMAVSSNLRYQLLAGVIEQRMLEPLLHKHKLILSALCFAVRTGNTFVGSLLWVDYARLIGIQ